MEKKKRFSNLASYGIVVAFLCLEVLAFVGFSLGHNLILYGSLFIALSILLIIVTIGQIKIEGIATFAYFFFPLIIYGVLSALSPFTSQSDGAFNLANTIFIPLTLLFAALCGFFVGHIKGFDLQKAFLVIYGSLALFVLINFIATMVYYVPFYTLIYKGSYIFFDGKPSPASIDQTAYMLFGFEILEVSLIYWSMYPAILLSSCVALFFIKFKEHKTLFLTYVTFTVLGAICLIFTISKNTIIGDLMLVLTLGLIILWMKIKKSHKALKIGLLVILVLSILGIIAFFLNAQTQWNFLKGYQDMIASSALLNRLFNTNRYAAKMNVILWEMFNPGKIFGSFVGIVNNNGYGVNQTLMGSWVFDNLLTSGLFGAIFFVFALVMAFRQMVIYFKNDKDALINRYLLFSYVIVTLAITMVAHDGIPLIYANNLYPVYMFTPMIISLFLMAYTFKPNLQMVKEDEKKEEINNEKISL